MVARPGTYLASLNSGEISPSVWGRSDIKQFYSAASLMQNVEPVPQGGWRDLPGTVQAGFGRNQMNEIAGVANNTLGPHAAAAVISTYTLPAIASIASIDLVGLTATVAVVDLVQLEVSPDNVNWFPFAAPFSVNSVVVPRRVAVAPSAGVSARYIRLRLIGAPSAATTFALTLIRVWTETAEVAAVARIFEFDFSVEVSFTLVLTPGNIDIWDGDTFIGSCDLPVTAAQLPLIKREQRLNVMYLWHPDLMPQRITRAQIWRIENAPFESIPMVQYEPPYGNLVNDVWNITVRWSAGPADAQLELTINGEDTEAVTIGAGPPNPDWLQFLIDLKAAIEGLPSVSPGVLVTQTFVGLSTIIRVEFAGFGNAGNRFTMTARVNNVTTAAATVSHPQFGDPGGEEIMSVTRGYPTTGQFYQDRLYQAGFKSEPGALLGSVTGEYLDLNTRIESAAGAILVRLDTSGAERIEHIARARHLVIFTNEAEYYITDRAITRTVTPNVAESSRNGIAPAIRPVENEGSLLYMSRDRSLLWSATYSDASQKYDSEPISLLATHLVENVRNIAIARASRSTDAARLFMPRDDGEMTVGVLIRNQEVIAFVRFKTDGNILDVAVDAFGRTFILVSRLVGGVARIFRERLDDAANLHCERTITLPGPQTVITGLSDYEGATIWARADGYFDKSYIVTNAQITLPYEATSVTVGRWTPPRVRTLPLPRLVQERTHLARPVRVHTVRVRLIGTTSLAIAANGGKAQDVPLLRAGDVSDQPIQPVSREVMVTGLAGYSTEGIVEFTQLRPGIMTVRDATLEVRS